MLDEESLTLMLEHDVTYVPTTWGSSSTGEFWEVLGTAHRPRDFLEEKYQTQREAVRLANQLGVRIAAGTDSALPVNPPDALVWELEWLVDGGLSAMEALQAATINGARALRLDRDLGTIEPGKIADVVIVDADPLERPLNLTRVSFVIQGGKIAARDGRLEDAEPIIDIRGVPDGPLPTLGGQDGRRQAVMVWDSLQRHQLPVPFSSSAYAGAQTGRLMPDDLRYMSLNLAGGTMLAHHCCVHLAAWVSASGRGLGR